MTPGLTDTITRDRFRSWAEVLKEQHATPLFCVAVGHGERSGQVHLVQVENVPTAEVVMFLRALLVQLELGASSVEITEGGVA